MRALMIACLLGAALAAASSSRVLADEPVLKDEDIGMKLEDIQLLFEDHKCTKPNGTFHTTCSGCVVNFDCMMTCAKCEHVHHWVTGSHEADSTCDMSCGCTDVANFDGLLTCVDGKHACHYNGPNGIGISGNKCASRAPTPAPYDHIHRAGLPNTELCEKATESGKNFLWAGFWGMFVPAALFAREAFSFKGAGGRMFHYMTMFVCLIASLAYLTMAMGYGKYYVGVGTPDCREFYYARYVDWAFTTPLMLLEVAGIAGASWDVLLWLLGTDFVMIIAGLIGAFISTEEKWAFWGFGMIVFQPILYYLVFGMDKTAKLNTERENNVEIYRLYKKISLITAVCWTFYPVVWMFCEGAGKWSLDMECFAYTVLDVLSKSVWGMIICASRTAVHSLSGSSSASWEKAAK